MATVTMGTLIGRGWAIFARQWYWLVGGGVAGALAQAALTVYQRPGGGLISSLLVLALQYIMQAFVARKAMLAEGLASEAVPVSYDQFLLTSLVVFFGAFFGSLLLIVPGIMLFLRWSLASSFVLAHGMSMREGLRASSEATRGHRWTILGAAVVVWVVLGLPYGGMVWNAGGLPALAQASAMGQLRLAGQAWGILAAALSQALTIGTFSVLARKADRLSEVFS